MHVQHYLIFTVCYSEEPATKKPKYSASEQRRATLRNTVLDNERLVLEKQKLVLEIEVLRETKAVMMLKQTLLLNQINQYTTVYTTES